MKRIVLISCVSQKGEKKAQAELLYQGALFTKSLAYARKLNPDGIYILSAKHHLLGLDKRIGPYDLTLNTMTSEERIKWGAKVVEQLKNVADIKNDTFIILAGEKYLEPIKNSLTNIEDPLKGLKIGKRLHFLTNQNK